MSSGNANQQLRVRVARLQSAVTTAYAALRAVTPLVEAYQEFYQACLALDAIERKPGSTEAEIMLCGAAYRRYETAKATVEALMVRPAPETPSRIILGG